MPNQAVNYLKIEINVVVCSNTMFNLEHAVMLRSSTATCSVFTSTELLACELDPKHRFVIYTHVYFNKLI